MKRDLQKKLTNETYRSLFMYVRHTYVESDVHTCQREVQKRPIHMKRDLQKRLTKETYWSLFMYIRVQEPYMGLRAFPKKYRL